MTSVPWLTEDINKLQHEQQCQLWEERWESNWGLFFKSPGCSDFHFREGIHELKAAASRSEAPTPCQAPAPGLPNHWEEAAPHELNIGWVVYILQAPRVLSEEAVTFNDSANFQLPTG